MDRMERTEGSPHPSIESLAAPSSTTSNIRTVSPTARQTVPALFGRLEARNMRRCPLPKPPSLWASRRAEVLSQEVLTSTMLGLRSISPDALRKPGIKADRLTQAEAPPLGSKIM